MNAEDRRLLIGDQANQWGHLLFGLLLGVPVGLILWDAGDWRRDGFLGAGLLGMMIWLWGRRPLLALAGIQIPYPSEVMPVYRGLGPATYIALHLPLSVSCAASFAIFATGPGSSGLPIFFGIALGLPVLLFARIYWMTDGPGSTPAEDGSKTS